LVWEGVLCGRWRVLRRWVGDLVMRRREDPASRRACSATVVVAVERPVNDVIVVVIPVVDTVAMSVFIRLSASLAGL
jgi:hypothetical protein